MDLQLTKETTSFTQEVFSGNQEQSVDLDITLPDYCSDILKVVKCIVTPQIEHRKISGDRLTVDGKTQIVLLYISQDEDTIKSCELSTPFSLDFRQKESYIEPIVNTKVRVDFFNCRCVTKRRVDIHGAFTIFAKIYSPTQRQILTHANGYNIETKGKSKNIDSVIATASQYFNVSEQLELAPSKPPISMIIKSDATAYLTECKAIAGKLIAKGEAIIKLLYSSSEYDELQRAEFFIPVSQIIDIEAITEDCYCDCKLEVLGYTITESDNLQNGLDVELKCCYTASGYKEQTISLIDDCYSTKYDLELAKESVTLYSIVDNIQSEFFAKGDVEILQDDFKNIIDIFGEITSCENKYEDGKLKIYGKINCCIIMQNASGEIVYIERPIEYLFEKEIDCLNSVVASPILTIKNLSYRLSSSSIEVKVEINICSNILCKCQEEIISDIAVSDNQTLKNISQSPLLIYYAQQNEQLWDIAKKYNTTKMAIMGENSLTSETLENDKMLLIPIEVG